MEEKIIYENRPLESLDKERAAMIDLSENIHHFRTSGGLTRLEYIRWIEDLANSLPSPIEHLDLHSETIEEVEWERELCEEYERLDTVGDEIDVVIEMLFGRPM